MSNTKVTKLISTLLLTLMLAFASFAFSACDKTVTKDSIYFVDGTYEIAVQQGTTFNLSGIVVKAVLSDKSEVVVSGEDIVITPIDTTTIGKKNLTASYKIDDEKTLTVTKQITVYGDLQSIAIKSGSIATTVNMGTTYSYENLVLVATFDDGDTGFKKEIPYNANTMTVSNIDTSSESIQTLTVTYQGKTTTQEIVVSGNYNIIKLTEPTFISKYKENSQLKNAHLATNDNGVIGFEDLGNTYVVGDDNAFIFQPGLVVFDPVTRKTQNLTASFNANFTVQIKEDNDYVEIEEEDLAKYVTIDRQKFAFDFTDKAIGKTFRITVSVLNDMTKSCSLVCEVIDGYNVYNVADFSVFDNVNGGEKWTEYKQAHNIPLDLNTNGIILHSNISITKDDVPAIHFYTHDEVYGAEDYDRVLGSLKDNDSEDVLGYLYYRKIANGKEFRFEGNYFQLTVQDLPLIVREEGNISSEGTPITTHTALLGIHALDDKTITEDSYPSAQFNNLQLFGNAPKSEDATKSGGILFNKFDTVNATVYNTVSQSWFISYMFRNQLLHSPIVYNLNKVNAFDGYNALLYVQGVEALNISQSHFIAAGGPVMICDHKAIENDDPMTGRPSYVNIDTESVLESWISGTEGWFTAYEGTGALAGQIKALNQFYMPMGMTMLDGSGEKLNLVAVYKSSALGNMTDYLVRGQLNTEDLVRNLDLYSIEEYLYIAQQTGLYEAVEYGYKTSAQYQSDLQEYGEEYCQAVLEQLVFRQVNDLISTGAGFFVTDSGAVGYPGYTGWAVDEEKHFNGTPDAVLLTQTQKYLYLYLNGGMGVVLSLNHSSIN